MFEAGFAYILSKSLINTRTKNPERLCSRDFYFFFALSSNFVGHYWYDIIVLWGLLLALINFFVPAEWFWIVYILQIINLSGAAGDFFVTVKFSRFPKDILVKDYGVGMTVYAKK